MGGAFSGGGSTTPALVTSASSSGRFGRKRLFLAGLVVFVLLGLVGYVFAFYIPNKPENVWKSAMTNTGKAYDMLTEYATKTRDAKGLKVDGSYAIKGDTVADGSFSGESNGSDSQVTGKFSISGLKLGFDLRSLKAAGNSSDLYFKFTGLQGLGALLGGGDPEVTSIFGSLNNQWFVIDHTLLQQYGGGSTGSQFTRADVKNLLDAIGTPSKDYVFTGDTDKSVLEVKSIVGSEEKAGRDTYHYKVGVNEAHLRTYAQALCESLKKDKIGKVLLQFQSGSDCKTLADDVKVDSGDTFDAWVDKRTKLVHVVRLQDKANAKNYMEISQDYQGGSSLPMGLHYHTDESGSVMDVTLTATLDMDANTLAMNGNIQAAGSVTMSGTFKLNVAPSNDPNLKVTKPANAKSFAELLNSLGLGEVVGSSESTGSTGTSSVQVKTRDSQRKADIEYVRLHLEVAYAQDGYYPTLAHLNDTTWQTNNLSGFRAPVDPQGTSSQFVSKPTAHAYAYQPTGCNASGCTAYTVTATLEAGGTYVKNSP